MNIKPPTWDSLSEETKSLFLMNNTIKFKDWYIDEVNNTKRIYSEDEINNFIQYAKEKKTTCGSYPDTDAWLYEAFDIEPIEGKSVAIMGSIAPWYEAITLAYGGFPTTIEYNLPNYNYPKIKEVLLTDALQSGVKFDVGISISSFEHDGLGRYGDSINPDGDLRAMNEMKQLLNKNGLLFLAVPVGLDKVVWNAHRVYGNKRLKLLKRE